MLKHRSETRVDGYVMEAHIPAAALTGRTARLSIVAR
jgi:hypothetical protein